MDFGDFTVKRVLSEVAEAIGELPTTEALGVVTLVFGTLLAEGKMPLKEGVEFMHMLLELHDTSKYTLDDLENYIDLEDDETQTN